jgi:tetratricopeptide (TPR) repeat protein
VFLIFQASCQKQSKEVPVTSYSDEAKLLFIEARNKFEFLHREKAEALLQEALEKDPLFAQAHIYRTLTCAATDEIENAVEKATKNAYRASEGEQYLIVALKAHYWEKDYLNALDAIDKTIDMALANGVLEEVARYKLAKCAIYSELKDYDNAKNCITDCQKVIMEKSLAPYYKDYYSSESLFWKAWIAAKQNNFDEALDKAAEYRAALEEMNDSRRLKYHIALLGHIAMNQGEIRSAYELLKNASIDDPFFHYLTANAKDKSGNKEDAAKYFRQAANWNTDSLNYALVRRKALDRKVMIASTEAQ